MYTEELEKAVIGLELEKVNTLVREFLDQGEDPIVILEALKMGMIGAGKLFERGEYFLSELIMSGEIMKDALKLLEPHLQTKKTRHKGKVVLATIEGDLHDIGKNIIKALLESSDFEVIDLGIDVPPKRIVEKAREVDADVIGISALLSTTVPTTVKVVEELKKLGIRDKVKVIVGGAAVRSYHTKKYGVDAAVNDAVEGVRLIESWVKTRRRL